MNKQINKQIDKQTNKQKGAKLSVTLFQKLYDFQMRESAQQTTAMLDSRFKLIRYLFDK